MKLDCPAGVDVEIKPVAAEGRNDRTHRQEGRHDPDLRRAGRVIPVTVIEAGPCPVVQVQDRTRTATRAVQLGFGRSKRAAPPRPSSGHFKKRRLGGRRACCGVPVDDGGGLEVGTGADVSTVREGDRVDVPGVTKGRGFQGVVKRHGFSGGRTHGVDVPQAARLDRRVGVPVARDQGQAPAGPHGRRARDDEATSRSWASTPSRTCCSSSRRGSRRPANGFVIATRRSQEVT